MDIVISKSDVFKEVERQSAFIGFSASADGSLFNKIYATEDDNQFMYNAWHEGIQACVQILVKYLDSSSVSYDISKNGGDEELEFKLNTPTRLDSGLLGSITTSIKLMLASNILYRWLVAKAPEIAPSYQSYVDDYSNGIKFLLSQRSSPTQSFSTKGSDNTSTVSSGEDYFPTKGSDNTSTVSSGEDYFPTKGSDNIKFEQYERCNINN